MSQASGLSYCASQVRQYDHDRYLTALFVPAPKREAVFALYAFNLEIAKTRETVSEPMLGQIRLQWWREAIDGIYQGKAREHPVVQALAGPVRDQGLSRKMFDTLIDSREFDLTDTLPETLADLENYAAASSGTLMELVQEALGRRGLASLMAAAHHIGLAWALVGLIRAFPHHARTKRLYLPASLLDAAQVDRRLLFEQAAAPGLKKVIEQLVIAAENHLSGARALRLDIPKDARAGLLTGALATAYIRSIRRAAYEPGDLSDIAVARPVRLLIASLRRRY